MAPRDEASVQLKMSGYDVHFPFKPYASQLGVMGKVLKAAANGENALLESPTGSGKSLALLCSALAWQEGWKRDHAKGKGMGDADVDIDVDVAGRTNDRRAHAASTDVAGVSSHGASASSKEAKNPSKVPRVYYATRTHSQIAQVVRELKRTPYRPAMVVLGSRDHYCIHKTVRAGGRNINEECKSLLESGGASGPAGGCSFSHGALKLASVASRAGAEPVDIEDLVKMGTRARGCPYFAAKHMAENAELVFCPYNYLLDPSVRSAMDIDVKGALVILDEAHNVEDTARDAASCDLRLHELRSAAEEFRRAAATEAASDGDGEWSAGSAVRFASHDPRSSGPADPDPAVQGYLQLAALITRVADWLVGAADLQHPRCPLRPHGFEQWMAVWSGGGQVANQMRDMGLDAAVLPAAEQARKAAVKEANDAKTPLHRRVGGAALKTAETLLTSARYALFGRGGVAGGVHDYRLVVQKSFAQPGGGGAFGGEVEGVGGGMEREAVVTLSLWALNPALAFNDLAGPGGARCVVLTSGTLAPLASFASELGVPFPIRMEAAHCVDMNRQVWAGAVATGPTGARLSGTFKTAGEFAYQDDLGAALSSWCSDIPHGVLVFFPSYSLLDRVAQRWRTTGAWKRLEAITGKKMFQEPRGNGGGGDAAAEKGKGRGWKGKGGRGGAHAGNSLDQLLGKYYRAVKASVEAAPHPHAAAPPGSPSRGAVLLAVCRGKISEGIDFTDANARAVVIVGIPYPNVKDKQVELKRQYNNEGVHRGLLSGDQWYSQQAFRALNQAVGRCLRHRKDHGAILLADERYAHGRGQDLTRHLPKWLRPAMRKCNSFEESTTGLRSFFEMHARDAPPMPPKEPLKLGVSVDERAKRRGAKEGSGRERGKGKENDGTGGAGKEKEKGPQKDITRFFAPVGFNHDPPPVVPAAAPPPEWREELEQRGGVGTTSGHGPGTGERRRGWWSAPLPPPLETGQQQNPAAVGASLHGAQAVQREPERPAFTQMKQGELELPALTEMSPAGAHARLRAAGGASGTSRVGSDWLKGKGGPEAAVTPHGATGEAARAEVGLGVGACRAAGACHALNRTVPLETSTLSDPTTTCSTLSEPLPTRTWPPPEQQSQQQQRSSAFARPVEAYPPQLTPGWTRREAEGAQATQVGMAFDGGGGKDGSEGWVQGGAGEWCTEDDSGGDDDVWGGTPGVRGTQGFSAQGWGQTQQFKDFAPRVPAPDAPSLTPTLNQRPAAPSQDAEARASMPPPPPVARREIATLPPETFPEMENAAAAGDEDEVGCTSPGSNDDEQPACYPISQDVRHVVKIKRLPIPQQPPETPETAALKYHEMVMHIVGGLNPRLKAAGTQNIAGRSVEAGEQSPADRGEDDEDASGGTQPEPEPELNEHETEPLNGEVESIDALDRSNRGNLVPTRAAVDTATGALQERLPRTVFHGTFDGEFRAGAEPIAGVFPSVRCASCGERVLRGAASAGSDTCIGVLRKRLDLSYLRTLLEANAAAGLQTEVAAAPDTSSTVVFVIPREDALAARGVCAKPVPVQPQVGEVVGGGGVRRGRIPAPDWSADCEGTWVPRDGCYYVPLRCGRRWIGARVEAADNAHMDLVGCTLLLSRALVCGSDDPKPVSWSGAFAGESAGGGSVEAVAKRKHHGVNAGGDGGGGFGDAGVANPRKRRLRKLCSIEAEKAENA